MMYVVLKPLPGPHARKFVPGQIVEADDWRNVVALVDQRYLRPATAEELASAVDLDETELTAAPVKPPSKPKPGPRVPKRRT